MINYQYVKNLGAFENKIITIDIKEILRLKENQI